MQRLEYKYYIPERNLGNLRNDILPYLNHDIYAKFRPNYEYTVRSIYLDSDRLHTYHEKLSGVKERNKYRVRAYNQQTDDSIAFIEIKRKDEDFISKDRSKIRCTDIESFLRTKNFSLLVGSHRDKADREMSARNFLYYYFLHQLKPTVLITYEREAFECKYGTGLRITFDKNIRAKYTSSFSDIFVDEKMTPSLVGFFVLEVKFHKIVPNWLPRVMNKYDIFRDSASKYVMSIDATNNTILKFLN
jgi:SPX domain protein involved in polyphosphate accumulation